MRICNSILSFSVPADLIFIVCMLYRSFRYRRFSRCCPMAADNCRSGTKKTTWYDVQIRVNENFRLEMHIDTDDANASGLKNGSTVTVAR